MLGTGGLTMASCKDCIHEEVCDIFAGDLNEDGAEKCICFKDRNIFIELPCKIGDSVYVKMQFGGYAEAEVRDYSYFISYGFCVVVTSTKFDKQYVPFSEFGKTIFLTREEAEQALKECEKNG